MSVLEENHSPLNHEEKAITWATKNGFPHWLVASIWLLIAFIAFQLVANVIAMGIILSKEGMPSNPAEIMALISANLRWVFVGNSIGQVSILALGTLFFSRIAVLKQERNSFFGFQKGIEIGKTASLSFLIMIVIQPLIWFMGWVNQAIPFPETYLAFEEQQLQLLIDFLSNEKSLIFILINVALVPAICEEVLFRGFIYRLYANSAGVIGGILISGFLFGLYHFKLTQLIPLSVIGMLLAWFTWKSGSLLPAIIAHFVNNGGSVIAAYFYPEYAFALGDEFMPPYWVTLLSLILTTASLILFHIVTNKGGKHVFGSKTV